MAEKTENMTKSCCQVRREEENDTKWFLITAADRPSVFISGKTRKGPKARRSNLFGTKASFN